jgi:hypothetical protein
MFKGNSSSRDAQDPTPLDINGPPPNYEPTTSLKRDYQPEPEVPPSGYRIPLSTPGPAFPGPDKTREAPFRETNGRDFVFFGSALMQFSVHPCKIAPHLKLPCRVPYGGAEIAHQGRFDLLPFVPEHMELVTTSNGLVPHGRRPIKGGFESTGAELYHAVAVINGTKVPGKTGTHLVRLPSSRGPTAPPLPLGDFAHLRNPCGLMSYQGACHVAYGGREHAVKENYEIL